MISKHQGDHRPIPETALRQEETWIRLSDFWPHGQGSAGTVWPWRHDCWLVLANRSKVEDKEWFDHVRPDLFVQALGEEETRYFSYPYAVAEVLRVSMIWRHGRDDALDKAIEAIKRVFTTAKEKVRRAIVVVAHCNHSYHSAPVLALALAKCLTGVPPPQFIDELRKRREIWPGHYYRKVSPFDSHVDNWKTFAAIGWAEGLRCTVAGDSAAAAAGPVEEQPSVPGVALDLLNAVSENENGVRDGLRRALRGHLARTSSHDASSSRRAASSQDASSSARTDEMKDFLRGIGYDGWQTLDTWVDGNGWNALHHAVQLSGSSANAKGLVEELLPLLSEATISATTVAGRPTGWTALHMVGNGKGPGRADIATSLLQHRADPTIRNPNGACGLLCAAGTGQLEVCRSMVDSGKFSLTTRNNNGQGLLEVCERSNGTVKEYMKSLGVQASQDWGGVSGRVLRDNGRAFGVGASAARRDRAAGRRQIAGGKPGGKQGGKGVQRGKVK